MVSLKTHNILDYVGGVALILAPFLFGFADVSAARNVFMLGGSFLILYSLFTNYYYSLVRVIPLGVHMTLDSLNGALLIAAPWIFNYRAYLTSGQEYLHYALGIGVLALVGLTREKTESDKLHHGIHVEAAASGRI